MKKFKLIFMTSILVGVCCMLTACGESGAPTDPCKYGHSGDWTETKAPTCGDTGEEKRTCTICQTVQTHVTASIGKHTYNWVYITDEVTGTDTDVSEECSVCAHKGETFKTTKNLTYVLDGSGGIIINGVKIETAADEEPEPEPKDNTKLIIPHMIESLTVVGIADSAFAANKTCVSALIPGTLTSIGAKAFESCAELKTVVFSDDSALSSLGARAFADCGKLSSITIPSGIEKIAQDTFRDCKALKTVIFAENSALSSIGGTAFKGCSELTAITLPTGVSTIGEYAFEACSKLTAIAIPNGVSVIAQYTFADCASLTSVTLPGSITTIGERAFEDCIVLAEITIPSGVTLIGCYAFSGCKELKSVTFADTDGWFWTSKSDGASGTDVTVTDPIENAKKLIGGYKDKYFKRVGGLLN